MSNEQNKMLVRQFFEAFQAGDVDEMFSLFADDSTWWVLGKPNQFLSAGPKDLATIKGLIKDLFFETIMPDGVTFNIKSLTAEDNRVSAEVDGRGVTSTGFVYDQNYHFLIEFENGKIKQLKEFLDTIHAREAFENVPGDHPEAPSA